MIFSLVQLLQQLSRLVIFNSETFLFNHLSLDIEGPHARLIDNIFRYLSLFLEAHSFPRAKL